VEVVEPAINATQIKGMGDLHAYFVQRGFKNGRMVIVPVEIPFIHLPEKHPCFVKRLIPQRDFQLPPNVAEAANAAPLVISPVDTAGSMLVSLS